MNIPFGWLIAFLSAIGGFVWLGGHLEQLFVPEEFLVIFGAAIGTLIASNKIRHLRQIGSAFASIFSKKARISTAANTELLSLMFQLLQKIRTNGVLAIENSIYLSAILLLRMVPDAFSRPYILAAVQPLLANDNRATYLSMQSFLGRVIFAVTLYGSATYSGASAPCPIISYKWF